MRKPVDPGGKPPALDQLLGPSRPPEQTRLGELIVRSPRYQLVVLGRYPSLVSADDPQVAVEIRVERDHGMANCGTLTLRESEWEPFRRALEGASEIELTVLQWPERLYTPA
jgi:hypothetical protein